jgi:hypothetical protein
MTSTGAPVVAVAVLVIGFAVVDGLVEDVWMMVILGNAVGINHLK